MTHRDELLALQARAEAQEQEIDEAKAEIALLRAAHAQKTREAEQLRRELAAHRIDTETPHEPTAEDDAPPSLSVTAVRRAFAVGAATLAISAVMSGMMVNLEGPCASRSRARAAALAASEPIQRTGHVVGGNTAGVVTEGDACTVDVLPVDSGYFDRRVIVTCGEQTLYGRRDAGYVHSGGRSVLQDRNVTEADGDPALDLDLVTGRLVVGERLGLGMQTVEIALDPAGTREPIPMQ